jgi:hypothetical protein
MKLNKSMVERIEEGLLELKELANSKTIDIFRKTGIISGFIK